VEEELFKSKVRFYFQKELILTFMVAFVSIINFLSNTFRKKSNPPQTF